MGRHLYSESYKYHFTMLFHFEQFMKPLGEILTDMVCGREPWISLRSGIYILIMKMVLTSHVTLWVHMPSFNLSNGSNADVFIKTNDIVYFRTSLTEPDTLCVTHHQLLLSLSLEIISLSFPHLLFYPALFPSFISIFPLWALSAFL